MRTWASTALISALNLGITNNSPAILLMLNTISQNLTMCKNGRRVLCLTPSENRLVDDKVKDGVKELHDMEVEERSYSRKLHQQTIMRRPPTW